MVSTQTDQDQLGIRGMGFGQSLPPKLVRKPASEGGARDSDTIGRRAVD
jgi:hypothetical protein